MATIQTTTNCGAGGATVITWQAAGGYVTLDGAPVAGAGTVTLPAKDHVAHVLAVDTAPLGERLTYTVLKPLEGCPVELAYTGAPLGAELGLAALMVCAGALIERAKRKRKPAL